LIEPKYMEFLSALAAGKRARLMMEITSDGITPLTIALAVATKQTGGQLICIGHGDDIEKSKALVMGNSLENVIRFEYGNPCEVIKQYKNIDFAVIDCKFQDHLKIFKTINLNPSGSRLVVNNLHRRRDGISFAGVVEGRNCGVKCVTLPIGEGMDFTRIGSTSKREISRRYKRFHVTYEN
jgi:predicted O-methyltransferase YrrM